MPTAAPLTEAEERQLRDELQHSLRRLGELLKLRRLKAESVSPETRAELDRLVKNAEKVVTLRERALGLSEPR